MPTKIYLPISGAGFGTEALYASSGESTNGDDAMAVDGIASYTDSLFLFRMILKWTNETDAGIREQPINSIKITALVKKSADKQATVQGNYRNNEAALGYNIGEEINVTTSYEYYEFSTNTDYFTHNGPWTWEALDVRYIGVNLYLYDWPSSGFVDYVCMTVDYGVPYGHPLTLLNFR